jgi:hypothetical protein
MRLSCLPAALLALAWAGTADACCFFKCCKRDEAQSRTAVVRELTRAKLTILSVCGQTPNSSGEIVTGVSHSGDCEVVVECDLETCQGPPPELTLNDLGPRTSAVPTKAVTKTYKHKKVELKLKWINTTAAATGISSEPIAVWVCVFTYTIPDADLDPNHNYSVFASVGILKSSSVKFHTAP